MPEERKYFIAAMIAIGVVFVFAAIAAFGLFAAVGLYSKQVALGRLPGRPATDVMIPGRLSAPFTISTMVEVKPVSGIHSEPSIQFELVDDDNASGLEAGIIRARKYDYRLGAFVNHASGTESRVEYLPPIEDRAHRMQLSVDGGIPNFSIDGREVYRFESMKIAPRDRLRLSIGTAMAAPGERPGLSMWDIRIYRGSAAARASQPSCSIGWGGVIFVRNGSRWTLQGTSDPSKRNLVHYCARH